LQSSKHRTSIDASGKTEFLASLYLVTRKVQGDTKKQELLKNPTKIEEIQEKKFNDRN